MTDLWIMPILNRNCIKLIGIRDEEHYACFKQIGDKFMALEFTGKLITWSIPTSKVISIHQLPNVDLSTYEVRSKVKLGAVLLKSKEAITDIDKEHFYEPF